ncbi:MAG: hypothetical protein KME64_37455 [Scytonematopsis contorta HA4267-MV1]|jgi:hypothetical protein|nr:hypothetical protein [Scytonematopsis contorta HA4267-MV1]
MKSSKHLYSLIAALVGACVTASFAIAQPKPSSNQAKLTTTQLKVLRSIGLNIALPTYVPANFRLSRASVEAGRENAQGLRYLVVYENYDGDRCFAIESTSGGIGDLPPGSNSYAINSPLFGKSSLEQGLYGNAKQQTLLSQWLGSKNGPFYRFVGANVAPELSRCNNISPQEAVKVTQSIRYLK